MKRRTFLAAGFAGWVIPNAAQAQTAQKMFRVGFLSGGGRTPDGAPPAPLREALRKLGYAEGRNISYEARFAEGKLERLAGLAAELVALKVDAITVVGGPSAMAAKHATSTIPIISTVAGGDLVSTGLIASAARPGGNLTGITDESTPLSAKRMEILKEAVPKAGSIAVLWNADDEAMTVRTREIERAARILKVEVQTIAVRRPEDFASAFAEMSRNKPDAIFLVADALTGINRRQVIEFAATQRIPAMYEFSLYVRDGGLISYGPSAEDTFQRAAAYLDRIFKGAKPGDLPAEYPTRYYLTVNLKAAGAMGLTIPPVLLLRADDVVK